jgi:hypothetical protein
MLSPSSEPKACRVCGKGFLPFQSMQVVCGVACARRVPIAARNTLKNERKATKKRLDELRPISHWVKQAQAAVNAWIRFRDRDLPCVSCGRMHAGKVNAGHFRSTAAAPELRFDEKNIWLQCEPCNTHLAGNLILYRAELIRRIGQAEVDRLEGPHEPKRYRADDLKAIRDTYRAKLKAEQKEAA